MMDLLHAINWLYVGSGFLVGFLVGLTGVGGGSLMTPLLILLFGVHPVTAVGTDLLYASVTKSGGSVVHGLNNTIDWRVVRRLATGSVPAAITTILILNALEIESSAASELVTKVLGVALVFTALALIFRRFLLKIYASKHGEHTKMTEAQTRLLTIGTGVVIGILVTISSVGAGAIGMTALILLYPNVPLVRLVGSDIAHAVPLTLVAGAGHWVIGSIDLGLLGTLLLGSLPGIVLASHLAPRAPEALIRYVLAGVLMLVAFKLLTA